MENQDDAPPPPTIRIPLEDVPAPERILLLPNVPPTPSGPLEFDKEYVTQVQKNALKLLERKRTELLMDEIGVDELCNNIVTSLVNDAVKCIMVTGGGSIFCGLLLDGMEPRLHLILGSLAFTFFTGVSLAAFAAFRKLNWINWRIIENRRRRLKVKDLIETFAKEVSYVKGSSVSDSVALSRDSFETRLSEIRDTLEAEGGGFRGNHLGFLVVIYLGAILCAISIMSFAYFMARGNHKGHSSS